MRRIAIAIGISVTLLGHTSAFAAGGAASSTTCITLLSALRHEIAQPGLAERTYILNSFRSIGSLLMGNPTGDNSAAPNTATGTIVQQRYSSGFSPAAAAGRIKGLVEFDRSNGDSEDRKFMLMTSVSGSENIQQFLDAVFVRNKRRSFPGNLVAVAYTMLGGAGSYMSYIVPELSPIAGVFALAGIESLSRIIHGRLTSFNGQIQRINADNKTPKGWGLYSTNFLMASEVIDSVMKSGEDSLTDSQEIYDTFPRSYLAAAHVVALCSRKVREGVEKCKADLQDTKWVGLDILSTTDADGVPELHIVIRGSHKAPVFPKGSQQRSEDDSGNPEILGPIGPMPIPDAGR